jgi:hypothetical protein
LETTDVIREFLWKHGNGAVRKVDACAPEIRLFVQRTFFFDIVADIGDRDIELQPPFSFPLYGDRIIKISCIFSVDGKRGDFSQVNPLSVFI